MIAVEISTTEWEVLGQLQSFPRMRREGFSLNSGGCARDSLSERPQPSAAVRSRALRRCDWGNLLERVLHGSAMRQIRVK